MGKILGMGSQSVKFTEPKAIEPPAPAVDVAAAPVTQVDTGASSADSLETIRKRYRPSRSGALGSSGTGLSL